MSLVDTKSFELIQRFHFGRRILDYNTARQQLEPLTVFNERRLTIRLASQLLNSERTTNTKLAEVEGMYLEFSGRGIPKAYEMYKRTILGRV